MWQRGIKVLAIFITVGLLFYYGYPFLMGETRKARSRYYLLLDQSYGLVASNEVRINGCRVGRIRELSLLKERDYKVLLKILVEEDIRISKEGSFLVSTDGLLGENFLSFRPSSEGVFYAPGDTIANVRSTVIDFEDVQAEIFSILEGLKEVSSTLQATLEGMLAVEGSVLKVAEKSESVVDEVHSLILRSEADVNLAFESIGAFARIVSSSAELTERIASSSLADDFVETAALLRQSTDQLSEILSAMQNGTGTVGRLLGDSSLYFEMQETLRSLNLLLVHFKESPRDFMAPLGRSRKKIRRREQRERKREATPK